VISIKRNDIKELQRKVDKGEISKDLVKELRAVYKNLFSQPIMTPVGKVIARNDCFEHIINRHEEMRSVEMIELAYHVLVNPDKVLSTTDKRKITARNFIGKIDNEDIIFVLERDEVIVAYIPSATYRERKLKDKRTVVIYDKEN
jgi:hypothetical protein